jgi:hypothetical protein
LLPRAPLCKTKLFKFKEVGIRDISCLYEIRKTFEKKHLKNLEETPLEGAKALLLLSIFGKTKFENFGGGGIIVVSPFLGFAKFIGGGAGMEEDGGGGGGGGGGGEGGGGGGERVIIDGVMGLGGGEVSSNSSVRLNSETKSSKALEDRGRVFLRLLRAGSSDGFRSRSFPSICQFYKHNTS